MNDNNSSQEPCTDNVGSKVKINTVAAPERRSLTTHGAEQKKPPASFGQRLLQSHCSETPEHGRVLVLFPGFDMVVRMDEQMDRETVLSKLMFTWSVSIMLYYSMYLFYFDICRDWFAQRGLNMDGLLLLLALMAVTKLALTRVIFHRELTRGERLAYRKSMSRQTFVPFSQAGGMLPVIAFLLLSACLAGSLYALGGGLGFYTIKAYGSVYAWGVACVLLALLLIPICRKIFARKSA